MDKKTELAIDLGQVIYTNTINSLTQQRDELLGVLQIARNGLVQWHVPDNRYAALTAIDAVLAKVGAGDTPVQVELLPANAPHNRTAAPADGPG